MILCIVLVRMRGIPVNATPSHFCFSVVIRVLHLILGLVSAVYWKVAMPFTNELPTA